MDAKNSRIEKINAELQKDIYEVITRRLKNPYITEMVSITAVDTSKDLKHAKVFISVFSTNKERKERTITALKEDAKRIRFELAKVFKARTVPEISFVIDESLEYGDKMDKLLLKIKKEENSGNV